MSPASPKPLTRRDFLKGVGACAASMAAASLLPDLAAAGMAYSQGTPDGPSVLVDVTRCSGCNSCALACKAANNLPHPQQEPTALASDTFTFVDRREVKTGTGQSATRFVKRQCMHCLNAACVSACPAAAMHKSAEGPVVYRADRCLGCRYCQLACPFEVPRFEWNNGLTPEISKCWMCYSRLKEGQLPACVEACPTGTLRFGRRSDLLAQAHAQIASNPDRYIDHVYGEFEVGGTSMLYLSDVPFDQLGFATLPTTAPPEQTEKIMNKLPHVIVGTAALMVGTSVITQRREKSHALDVELHSQGSPAEPDKEA